MTLEQQVHLQEVTIRKLKEEIEAQKRDIQKIVDFFNDTRINIEQGRVKTYRGG